MISQLNKVIIGFTVLAWGTSLADFVADTALAKQGLGVMAVTGVFAGEFFNTTIGFGIYGVRFNT